MEVYLNVAETGHGIYGMPMASEIYFDKKLKKLSKSEIATLVALLPSPLSFNPTKQSRKFTRRKNFIMREVDRIVLFDLDKRICVRKYKRKKENKGKQ